MRLITWNIQWGRGVDGRVDLARIVDTARAMADFDVLCLQEVSRSYPGLAGGGADQFAALAGLLPGYHAVEAIAVDRFTEGIGRQQFGNLILTRLAPQQALRHQLPWPADCGQPSMPRVALEVVVATGRGAVSLITTHLEFYSARQRAAQFEALRRIQSDAAGHVADQRQIAKAGSPFETRPRGSGAILTGDFNCPADDPLIVRLQAPLDGGAAPWCDAWALLHPGAPHPATVGVYDKAQWQGTIACYDFVFLTADIAAHASGLEVNPHTAASDHQPLLLDIDL